MEHMIQIIGPWWEWEDLEPYVKTHRRWTEWRGTQQWLECAACAGRLPASEFYRVKGRKPYSYCKACTASIQKKLREKKEKYCTIKRENVKFKEK